MQLGERERAHRALGFPRETVVNCIHGAHVTACGAAEADTGYYYKTWCQLLTMMRRRYIYETGRPPCSRAQQLQLVMQTVLQRRVLSDWQ